MKAVLKALNKFIPQGLKISLRSFLFDQQQFSEVSSEPSSPTTGLPQITNACLILGHSNPLKSLGGTERVILQELEQLLTEKRDFVFIYPKTDGKLFHLQTAKSFGIIVNGVDLASVPEQQLVDFIGKLDISEIRIHHLGSWRISLGLEVLKLNRSKAKSISVYVHDFYFKCPAYNARCINDELQCNGLYTKTALAAWRNKYSDLFEICDKVLVPSEFVAEQLPSSLKSKIAFYVGYQDVPVKPKEKLAFLGSGMAHKGYETWVKLSHNALVTRLYDLTHVGNAPTELTNVENVPYSFQDSRACVAVKILKDRGVKKVLLWSQVPETYSYTLQEALAAGSFVLTCEKSGNINAVIQKNQELGKSFRTEYDLIQFLLHRQ